VVVLHFSLVLIGIALLGLAMAGIGPSYVGGAGAVVVSTAYTWILAARVGGRWVVFALLALTLGVTTLVTQEPLLCAGAAVMTASLGAVLGVMATVPAVTFLAAVREVLIAMLISAVGAVAAIGFEPTLDLRRFDYATLAVSLAVVLALVYRLGAGLHGLGTRGLVIVVGGFATFTLTLVYAELLRRYGTPGLVDTGVQTVAWTREHLGAFPRPLQALLGIPALAWGAHQRARRRQGWWASAFGVAATAPVAHVLVNPSLSLARIGLIELYSVVIGLGVAYVVIRGDLALTGSRGRGGRRAEEATAIRPEPPRTQPLH
jgi:hypothetical protein